MPKLATSLATPLLLALLGCVTQPALAQDKLPEGGLCKPVCVSARQDCRAQVQAATESDTSPVLSMKPASNRYAAAARENGTQSQQLRPTEAQAFRERRAERLQTCEVQYRSCTRSCG